jgi:Fic-DOC domain mobile mystery protein B
MTTNGITLSRGLPGETPLDDISGLKPKWVRTVAALSKVEFTNVGNAIHAFTAKRPTSRTAPFTRQWMCKVHRKMYCDVWTWAGAIRSVELNIGVPWHAIEGELETLCQDITAWQPDEKFDLIAQAATIHHRAVKIHPFLNGNGRWSRLLSNIWLRKHDTTLIAWPEDGFIRQQSPARRAYIAALKQADAGDIDPLVALHRKYG